MKRLVAVMMMAVMVLAGGIVLGVMTESNGEVLASVEHTGQVRTMQCIVVAEDESVMTVEDECHNLWVMLAGELHKGDVICVWFDDMNTPKDLTDDEILDYCDVVVD